MQEIERRFAENDWGLRLDEEDDRWVASFFPVVQGVPTFAHEITGRTKLEAAEAARAKYKRVHSSASERE